MGGTGVWVPAICLVAGLACGAGAHAQMAAPEAPKPTGAELFKRQCASCHTVSAAEGQRAGPTMAGVVGRKAGTVPGFHYSAGFANADWQWDEAHLDTWLTNPQAMIPGAIMPYRQPKAEIRAALIAYLTGVQ